MVFPTARGDEADPAERAARVQSQAQASSALAAEFQGLRRKAKQVYYCIEGIGMRVSAISIPFQSLGVLAGGRFTKQGMPIMRSVQPASGNPGEVQVFQGENLWARTIAGRYRSGRRPDSKVPIVEQTGTSTAPPIPPEVNPVRFARIVLPTDNPPAARAGQKSLSNRKRQNCFRPFRVIGSNQLD